MEKERQDPRKVAVRENLRKLIVPLIQSIHKNRPTDYVNYCAEYFNKIYEKNTKQMQSTDNAVQTDDGDFTQALRTLPLHGSASLSALVDENVEKPCLRETNSWNNPSESRKLQKSKQNTIYNKADFCSQIGDQPDVIQKNQTREDAILISKDEDASETDLEGNEEESARFILEDKSVFSGYDSLSYPSNEEIDDYLCRLIDTASTLTSTIKPELEKRRKQLESLTRGLANRSKSTDTSRDDSSNSDDSDDIDYYPLCEEADTSNRNRLSPGDLKLESATKNRGQVDAIDEEAISENLIDSSGFDSLIHSYSNKFDKVLDELKRFKSDFCKAIRWHMGYRFPKNLQGSTCRSTMIDLSQNKGASASASESSESFNFGEKSIDNALARVQNSTNAKRKEANENAGLEVKQKRISDTLQHNNIESSLNGQRFSRPLQLTRQANALPTYVARPFAAVRPSYLSLIGEQGDVPPQTLVNRYSVEASVNEERNSVETEANVERYSANTATYSGRYPTRASAHTEQRPVETQARQNSVAALAERINVNNTENSSESSFPNQKSEISEALTQKAKNISDISNKLAEVFTPLTNQAQIDVNAYNCNLKLESDNNNSLSIVITVENNDDLKIEADGDEKPGSSDVRAVPNNKNSHTVSKGTERIYLDGRGKLLLNGDVFFDPKSDLMLENANLRIEEENDNSMSDTNISAYLEEAKLNRAATERNETASGYVHESRQIRFNLKVENCNVQVKHDRQSDNSLIFTMSDDINDNLEVYGDFSEIPANNNARDRSNNADSDYYKIAFVDDEDLSDEQKKKAPLQGRIAFTSDSKLLFQNISLQFSANAETVEGVVTEESNKILHNATDHQHEMLLNNTAETVEMEPGSSEKGNNSSDKDKYQNGEQRDFKSEVGYANQLLKKKKIVSETIAKQNMEPGWTSAGGDFLDSNVDDDSGSDNPVDVESHVDSSSNNSAFSAEDVEKAVREALDARRKVDDADDFDYFFDTDASDSDTSELSDESSTGENCDC